MALINALSASKKKSDVVATGQFDGIKLANEDVAELYPILGLEAGSPGAEAFEVMIEQVTGIASPERANKETDGKFIGKKLSILPPTKDSTVFNNHNLLCEKLGLPANSTGAQVFRHLLSNLPEVIKQMEAQKAVTK